MRAHTSLARLSLAVVLATALFLAAGPGLGLAVNLLVNGSFEIFQDVIQDGVPQNWRGFPEKYGQGWTLRVLQGTDDLHLMDSDTFGQFMVAVFHLGYLNYHLEGNLSQAMASRYAYDFVLSQTVTVQPGLDYSFGGKIVTFWKGPGGETDATKIFKRIGIDPAGGTAYDGATVIWTDWDSADNAWTSPALAATAQDSTMTVFIQVKNTGGDVGSAYLNTGYIDSFKFERAPIAALTLPAAAPPGPVSVAWDATLTDPGYWTIWGYDVEYKDSPAGAWQRVQTHDQAGGQNKAYTLTAEPGQTYTVRVRAWQQHGTGDAAVTALPGVWTEKSVTINNQAVTGRVINASGLGLAGVTVTAAGLPPALSRAGGAFSIPTGANGPFTVTAGAFGGLAAPPPTTVTVSEAAAGAITLTLRPAGSDQVIQNNDFETGLAGWTVTGGSPAVSTLDRHTGTGSLLLAGSADGVSQGGVVTAMYRPLLSFWYRSDVPFTVELLGADPTPVQTRQVGPAATWQFMTLAWPAEEFYTGSLGVKFGGGDGNTFIDEVSLSAGLRTIWLPYTSK